ncbi:Lipoprotein-releasing system transmembrane protein LolC [compost metagenome]
MKSSLSVLTAIAAAHLRLRLRQTIVAVSGVGIGVGFFLAVSGMMSGSQKDFIRTLVDSAPHIIVTDERRRLATQPAPLAFPQAAVSVRHATPKDEVRGLRNWTAMLEDARALPGAAAAPALGGAVSLTFAGRTAGVALTGVDPATEVQVSRLTDTLIGARLDELQRRPDGIIISRPLAQRIGAEIGDTLVVTAPGGRLQRMRILALVNPDARAGLYAGDTAAYCLLRTAQVVFARPNIVNQLHIRLADPTQAERQAGVFEQRWGYRWESWQERSREVLNLLVVRNIIMYAVSAAILIVAVFGVYTGVSNSVADKRRDIAILRAIGFTAGDLQIIFLLEGMAVAAIGVMAGFALGTGLLEALSRVPLRLGGQPLTLPLDRGLTQYAIAGLAALVVSLLAAWLPARRAALVDPIVILRGAA